MTQTMRKENTVEKMSAMIVDKPVVTIGEFEKGSLIPVKVNEYVPFGHFRDIRTILESGQFSPIFISGDSGNGKTMMCEQVCAQLNRECIVTSFDEETGEEDLIGGFRLIDGSTVWEDGAAVVAMKRGAVLVLDEVDMGMMKIMCLQQMLDGRPIYIKKIGQVVQPADGFMVIATANTKGRGSTDNRYVGNNYMNEAFLERFAFSFEQDYPKRVIEHQIVMNMMEKLKFVDEEFATNLTMWSEKTRNDFNDGIVSDLISTRRLVHIVKAFTIFRNRRKAITIGINRFDEITKNSFIELYSKMDERIDMNYNKPSPDAKPGVVEYVNTVQEIEPETTESNFILGDPQDFKFVEWN